MRVSLKRADDELMSSTVVSVELISFRISAVATAVPVVIFPPSPPAPPAPPAPAVPPAIAVPIAVVLPPAPPRAPRAPEEVLFPELAETSTEFETFATVVLVTVILAANKLGAPTRAMVPIRANIFLDVCIFIK